MAQKRSSKVEGSEELLRAMAELERKVDRLLAASDPNPGKTAVPTLDGPINSIDLELDRCMVRGCDNYVRSRAFFTDLLDRCAALSGLDRVEEVQIADMRRELGRARANAPYSKCAICFDGVSALFDRQVKRARTQNSYVSEENLRALIGKMDEEAVVRNVVDPLSNPQRLEILKLLNSQPMTYSQISQRTGLKGGNLLFHIQKLLSSGLIAQNQERGDYSLTDKGGKVLRYLTLMTLELGIVKWA